MNTLHESLLHGECRLFISATGAGLGLAADLWCEPGASSYLVGGITPYSQPELARFIGRIPLASTCSFETALDMASMSYITACEHCALEESGRQALPIGLAITAAVASNRIPRGAQRAHLCAITPTAVRHLELRFEKSIGSSARREQDQQITREARELLHALLLDKEFGSDVEPEALDRLFRFPAFSPLRQREVPSRGDGACYLPATLNPLHEGHREMARRADAALGTPGCTRFLVTATPVHKPNLRVGTLLDKVGQVWADCSGSELRGIEFSRDDPLFLDKVKQRPDASFVVGADTLARLLDPTWGPSTGSVLQAFAAFGARFFVMGRQVDGRFLRLRDIPIPREHAHLFHELDGRVDQSSTALREYISTQRG